ncbi:hypothetical protein OPV22_018026 [Ensete ventricosum]|uniref:Cupin type-1 domain-containing protein n=1 Tax=Ensete ventricosum TaxID=4639 RepID=A0AAV8PIF4_ENSVE|nr:hypothetical protein OPV22_018026 [Ensete ventricosum]
MAAYLSPTLSKSIFEGAGGSYATWSGADLPLLTDAKLGGGKLVLKPLGLALPHYSDSSKVGYVLEGRAVVGLTLYGETKHRIMLLEKGDVVALVMGSLTWWYNEEDSDFSIAFLGDTTTAVRPGDIAYFVLAGSVGVPHGFSTEFLSRACGIREAEAEELFGSQPGTLIITLQQKLPGLRASRADREGIVVNAERVAADIKAKSGGCAASVTSDELAALGGFRFSVDLTRLESNAMRLPGFFVDAAVQLIYVAKGSGRVQIAGTDGNRALDAEVKEGHLFGLPKFFAMSVIAGGEGMEWFSIITSPRPAFEQLTGRTSELNMLPSQILESSLNVTPDLVKLLKTNGSAHDIFASPSQTGK